MNLEEWYSLPPALVNGLPPDRVRQYVLRTGWKHEQRLDQEGISVVYYRPESNEEQLLIPLNPNTRQFLPCMRDVLVYIAEWEKRPARDILDELLLPSAASRPGTTPANTPGAG
jgi:hypothetical protein